MTTPLRSCFPGFFDFLVELLARQVDQQIARIVATQGNTAFLAHLLLDLGLYGIENPAIGLAQS